MDLRIEKREREKGKKESGIFRRDYVVCEMSVLIIINGEWGL